MILEPADLVPLAVLACSRHSVCSVSRSSVHCVVRTLVTLCMCMLALRNPMSSSHAVQAKFEAWTKDPGRYAAAG
jgi:hypothetical protein